MFGLAAVGIRRYSVYYVIQREIAGPVCCYVIEQCGLETTKYVSIVDIGLL